MLEKFQQSKIGKHFYWLNAFLTKSKSIFAENKLNQWKIIKNITTALILRKSSRLMSSKSFKNFSLETHLLII